MHLRLKKMSSFALVITLLTFGSYGYSQTMNTNSDQNNITVFTPDTVKWMAAPAVLPKGSMMAVLQGNPKEQGPFTARLKLPANTMIKAHTHSETENVTVISGTLYLGLNPTMDKKKAKKLPAGSFFSVPANTAHYAYSRSEVILQLNNTGPWEINYVDHQDNQMHQ